ncbi:MAG TPA: hypothetical protein DCQ31_09720 [Bacteroidales bacterium]|nr:hypothetical protein [Bacteroidales bacterium]
MEKIRLYFVLIGIAFCVTPKVIFSQDPQFSQFYANRLYFNPSLAGISDYARISVNYRNLWPLAGLPFHTYSVSYDQNLPKINSGMGLRIMNDQAGGGAITTTTVDGIYSYHFNLTKKLSLSAGLELSYIRRSINLSNLIFQDMLNESGVVVRASAEGVPSFSPSVIDVSSGTVLYSDNYYIGFAAHHINQSGGTIQRTDTEFPPRKFTIHAGGTIPIGARTVDDSRIYLQPSVIYQQQGKIKQAFFGTFANRKYLTFGIWGRYNVGANFDAIIILGGINMKDYQLAYSFDYTLSSLFLRSLGAHEISFSYRIKTKGKDKKRMISCPRF